MQIFQNAYAYFQSLSSAMKAIVIIATLIVGILASQAFYVIALLVFMVGIVALIVRAVRRKPLRQWGIVTAGALVLAIFFGSISGGSPAPTEQASQEEPVVAEEPAVAEEEPAEEEPAVAEEEPAEEEPPAAAAEPEPEPTAVIGQSVEVDEATWVVTNARQATQLNDQFGGITPPKQGNFVIVDFRFRNDSNEAKTLHPGALKLIDEDGREFDPDTDTFSYIPPEENLFLEQVNPGVTKDAEVIFSVAPDASGFNLQLRGTSLFSLAEPEEVALGF